MLRGRLTCGAARGCAVRPPARWPCDGPRLCSALTLLTSAAGASPAAHTSLARPGPAEHVGGSGSGAVRNRGEELQAVAVHVLGVEPAQARHLPLVRPPHRVAGRL